MAKLKKEMEVKAAGPETGLWWGLESHYQPGKVNKAR